MMQTARDNLPAFEMMSECARCKLMGCHYISEPRWMATFEQVQMAVVSPITPAILAGYWDDGFAEKAVVELPCKTVEAYRRYQFVVRECSNCHWQWIELTGNTDAVQVP